MTAVRIDKFVSILENKKGRLARQIGCVQIHVQLSIRPIHIFIQFHRLVKTQFGLILGQNPVHASRVAFRFTFAVGILLALMTTSTT